MFHLSKSKNINFAKIYKSGQRLLGEIPPIKESRRRKKFFKFLKYFNLSILILFLFAIVFLACFLGLSRRAEDAPAGASRFNPPMADTSEGAAREAKGRQFEQTPKELAPSGRAAQYAGAINDYLMIAEDSPADGESISRGINYKVEEAAGGFFSKLRVNYTHHGKPGQKTAEYKTYIRVFAPLGSRLIKAERVSASLGETAALEQTETKNESDKTSFGAFINVKPGEIGGLYFEYKLPENFNKLTENRRYELYIQKQSGNNAGELNVDLNFINDVQSYNPTGFYAEQIGDNRIRWESDLGMDKRYVVDF
ncbi:hypothetical protein KJ586_03445 [Patescibacteria group bacterium]|nr:hypothetical protein [Patescibacteria group bacterium]MBU4347819.1 hypothetical protein [Patescibacteria group bacterium]MBU4455537.1 hypothetical protein [Patescibacteria group bacterium]